MSGWGIADTAPKIEKIKAESADYLHGLDSCGIISWSTYSDMFDFYEYLIEKAYAQGKEDAQPEIKWETCFDCPLSHGCPKIKGCTTEQAIEYASQIPNDCPLSAQPEYDPVTAEDFAKTMSENTLYSFMTWHGEALELMERQGFVICKKTM